MEQNQPVDRTKIVIDWLTTMAIAAVAICLTQIIHEGLHALTCIAIGAELQEFSALHVFCESVTGAQSKFVSGSSSVVNLMIGAVSFVLLRRSRQRSSELQFFLWLFMLMNWLLGAGYLFFSGVANVGDWALVIDGWEPQWLWRLMMAAAGLGIYTYLIWLALHELGKLIGGDDFREQIGRATRLGLFSYITVFLVIFFAGLFNPYGITGLPAVAALLLALGGMSPLVWMMQWFRSKRFAKLSNPPLEIHRQWTWIVTAGMMIFLYAFILGRSLYF